MLPSSWDRWAAVVEEAGYTALTPGWPDDPGTVEEANEHPEVFADKTVGQVADHYCDVISLLERKPAVDHRRREGPDCPAGHCQRQLQEAGAQ